MKAWKSDVAPHFLLPMLVMILAVDPDLPEGAIDCAQTQAYLDVVMQATLGQHSLALLYASVVCLKQYALADAHHSKSKVHAYDLTRGRTCI